MPHHPRSPALAPHVQAAIGAGLQAKAPPRAAGAMAPHVQRAVQGNLQAKPVPPAGRSAAPHVQAAISRSPPPRSAAAPQVQRKARGAAAPHSIQPFSAWLHKWTCGCLGSPAAPVIRNDDDDGASLLERGQAKPPSSSVAKRKPRKAVPLGQGQSGAIPYGGAAINQGTTTCGLVLLHTDGAAAMGFHWPFCLPTSANKADFDSAISGLQGTGIQVVVNGGRYRAGDGDLAKFGPYLQKTYGLPVTVYRQVSSGSDGADRGSDTDPWVDVDKGRVSASIDGYELVPV